MYFSSLFPYVVLACFLVRGLLLRGAVDGILHMFTPKVRVCGPPHVGNPIRSTGEPHQISFMQFHMQTLLCVRCSASSHGEEQGKGHRLCPHVSYTNLGKIRKGSRKEVASEMRLAEQDGLWQVPV